MDFSGDLGSIDSLGLRSEEMRDVLMDGEDCVGVFGPGPEVRAYEQG